MPKKTLSEMTLDELHEEGERLRSNAILALDRTIPEMAPAEVLNLQAELRAEAARDLAEAKALRVERRRQELGDGQEALRLANTPLEELPDDDLQGLAEMFETRAEILADRGEERIAKNAAEKAAEYRAEANRRGQAPA